MHGKKWKIITEPLTNKMKPKKYSFLEFELLKKEKKSLFTFTQKPLKQTSRINHFFADTIKKSI